MTWEEIEEEFNIAPIWMDWLCTTLTLNGLIESSNKCTELISPKQYHQIYKHSTNHLNSITKFKEYKINTSKCNNDSMLEDWIRVMKLKENEKN